MSNNIYALMQDERDRRNAPNVCHYCQNETHDGEWEAEPEPGDGVEYAGSPGIWRCDECETKLMETWSDQ